MKLAQKYVRKAIGGHTSEVKTIKNIELEDL